MQKQNVFSSSSPSSPVFPKQSSLSLQQSSVPPRFPPSLPKPPAKLPPPKAPVPPASRMGEEDANKLKLLLKEAEERARMQEERQRKWMEEQTSHFALMQKDFVEREKE